MTTPHKAPRADVWELMFKAQPSPDHPTLAPDKVGTLVVIVAAADRQRALQKALLVFTALPFVSAGDDVLTASAEEHRASGAAAHADAMIEITSASGLAVTFNPDRGI